MNLFWKKWLGAFAWVIFLNMVLWGWLRLRPNRTNEVLFRPIDKENLLDGGENKAIMNIFEDRFEDDGLINETARMNASNSPSWWLSSGGKVTIAGGLAKSVSGNLSEKDEWYEAYKRSNPQDTDGGSHPQNILRLVNRGKWLNYEQELYFRIKNINMSASENRNESNGVMLFNRYKDSDNLYYAGLRVDGKAVIKKKIAGIYHTIGESKVFEGSYDRDKNPNMLTMDKWMGVKSVIRNKGEAVEIIVYVDVTGEGRWREVVRATDDGKRYGQVFGSRGYAGIRTDFMDVEFDKYRIGEIKN